MKRVVRCAAWAAVLGFLMFGLTVSGNPFHHPAATTSAEAGPFSPSPAAEARSVDTSIPGRQPGPFTVEQTGPIESVEQTPLHAKIAGTVTRWNADIGDRVRAGQVMAELALPELREELRQKEAAVELGKASVLQARRAFKAAEANLDKAEAAIRYAKAGRTRAEASYTRWRAEYDRVRRLMSSRAVDAQTRDQTLDQLKSAEAARDESHTGIELATAARDESKALRDEAESAVGVAEAKLAVALADRRHTAALLDGATIRAPFNGIVTERNVDTGTRVEPSVAGKPLFVVVRTGPLRLFIDVPEASAASVRPGAPVRVRVPALAGETFEGRVARSRWVLDARTRTLRTQIDLPDGDERLRPGMSARAALTVERSR